MLKNKDKVFLVKTKSLVKPPKSVPNPEDVQARMQELETLFEPLRERAFTKWTSRGPHLSAHEGYGRILEEIDEVKEEVFKKSYKRNLIALREELVHVAVAALTMAVDM